MLLAQKWAWEALLHCDNTSETTVEQIGQAVDRLTDVQPTLRARVILFWLRKVTYTDKALGSGVVIHLWQLANMVKEHAEEFDDAVIPSMLCPDVNLALRVGFVLVLRKLQGLTYPGCEAEESHTAAFDRHCGPLWQSAGDYGTEIVAHFDELMEKDTPLECDLLPHLARQMVVKTGLTDIKVMQELEDFVRGASEILGPSFLHKLAALAEQDDLVGYSILEQLAERPRKRQRPGAREGGPSDASPQLGSPEVWHMHSDLLSSLLTSDCSVAIHIRLCTAGSLRPEWAKSFQTQAYANIIAAAVQGLGATRTPTPARRGQIMNDASAQRLNQRVREREAYAENGLYLEPAGGAAAGTPARPRVPTPNTGGAGQSQPRQQGRTLEWVDTPGEVPDPPMESPPRRAYRPPSYQTPRGPGVPKGRRKTVRWSLEEANRLKELVVEYGYGSWVDMIRAMRPGELITRRSQVDLKDKWRNMCKSDPTLDDVGKENGDQPGPHGTPAALRLPPAEQVDENAPPGGEGVAGDAALHNGNGAPAAAGDGEGAAVAATGRADGEDDTVVAGPAAAEGAAAGAATAEGTTVQDPAANTEVQGAAAETAGQAAAE